jgi:hypothetical protein
MSRNTVRWCSIDEVMKIAMPDKRLAPLVKQFVRNDSPLWLLMEELARHLCSVPSEACREGEVDCYKGDPVGSVRCL